MRNNNVAKVMTGEDFKRGYVICGCLKFAHVFRAAVLKSLPKGYHGELCLECSCFMVAVDKLPKEDAKETGGCFE